MSRVLPVDHSEVVIPLVACFSSALVDHSRTCNAHDLPASPPSSPRPACLRPAWPRRAIGLISHLDLMRPRHLVLIWSSGRYVELSQLEAGVCRAAVGTCLIWRRRTTRAAPIRAHRGMGTRSVRARLVWVCSRRRQRRRRRRRKRHERRRGLHGGELAEYVSARRGHLPAGVRVHRSSTIVRVASR